MNELGSYGDDFQEIKREYIYQNIILFTLMNTRKHLYSTLLSVCLTDSRFSTNSSKSQLPTFILIYSTMKGSQGRSVAE